MASIAPGLYVPEMDSDPGPDETLDQLSGGWWIFQLRRGQRYATDDVITAWTAFKALPNARAVLDLGSGVGSIGLMTLRLLQPEARLVSVEIQKRCSALQRRTVAHNGIAERVEIRGGDIRDRSIIRPDESFDLITANPPYLPLGAGWKSPYPERAAARFELNGDVFDYCEVAARHLAPQGRFCLCHVASDQRPEKAISAAGLAIIEHRRVFFRRGQEPRLALYVCARAGRRIDIPELYVRDKSGQRTDEYRSLLRDMGIIE